MRAYTLGLIVASAAALTLPPSAGPSAVQSRRGALSTGAGVLAAAALGVSAPRAARAESTGSGLQYSVVKNGSGGGKPVTGDLIAIRFKCVIASSGAVIDDIMNSAEPYYYRAGSGQVVPAIEEAVLQMTAGDVWELTVPPNLGFGTKGRSSSPGKPRISGDAILKFTLALDAVPGKDEEIIDMNGVLD